MLFILTKYFIFCVFIISLKYMKITAANQKQYKPSFKGLMTNKHILNGLEHIADHGTTFVAAATLVMAAGVRPFVTAHAPGVDKENREYSAANSIASGVIKFAMTEAVALPVENAVKEIDNAPEKYLKEKTVKTLKGTAEKITDSEKYNIITQTLKLGAGLVTAIPKSMLTIAILPFIMDLLFLKPKKEKQNNFDGFIKNACPEIFGDIGQSSGQISFKGSDIAAKGIAKIIDSKTLQNIVTKHNFSTKNIARNMSMATDILLTASFVRRTQKSKKIKEDGKKPLIYNNILSTGISLTAGYAADKIVQNGTKNFIDKFSLANKGNPKLDKYIQGINIVRPTLIFAGIYYGILPLFTTYIADKTDKFIKSRNNNKC